MISTNVSRTFPTQVLQDSTSVSYHNVQKRESKRMRDGKQKEMQTLFSYIVITNETWRGQTGLYWCLENKDSCSVTQDRLLFHLLDILSLKIRPGFVLKGLYNKNRAEELWDLFASMVRVNAIFGFLQMKDAMDRLRYLNNLSCLLFTTELL